MPPVSDHRVVFDAIRLIVQDLREASRAAETEFGIGAAQLFVLQTLAHAPAMSVNELAARTYTHQSSVSVVLKKLQQRQLVTAKASPADARRRELSLTAKGFRVAEQAPDAMQLRLIAALNRMAPIERARLARGCRCLVRAMGAKLEKAPMFPEDRRRPVAGRRKRTLKQR